MFRLIVGIILQAADYCSCMVTRNGRIDAYLRIHNPVLSLLPHVPGVPQGPGVLSVLQAIALLLQLHALMPEIMR